MELFNKILKTAVAGGASDIHIKANAPVVYRISSQLVETEMAQQPEESWLQNIIHTIVPEHFKSRLEDDREIDFSYYLEGVGRFRTNCFQHLGKWCLAMRYVVAEVPKISDLGLPEVIKSIAEEHRGIVLVAGTTGCGKSTTLAGMIDHINNQKSSKTGRRILSGSESRPQRQRRSGHRGADEGSSGKELRKGA